MNFEKENAAFAAQELDEIAEKMEAEMAKDMKPETETFAADEATAENTETINDETEAESFEKKNNAKASAAELKQSIRELFCELGKGARDVIRVLRENVPNKTLRILMKIGVGIAIYSIVGSKIGRLAIAIAAVVAIFGTEAKEEAK